MNKKSTSASLLALDANILMRYATYNHVDRELKLSFDDLDEDIFWNKAIFVRLTAKRDKGIKIFVHVSLNVIVQLLVLVPLYT